MFQTLSVELNKIKPTLLKMSAVEPTRNKKKSQVRILDLACSF